MTITKPPDDYSVWKEAALVISLLFNCINLIGFVSNSWGVRRDKDYDKNFEGLGLWKCCSHESEGPVICLATKDSDMPSWFVATQAMATIGFICMVTSFFTIVVSECHKKLRGNQIAVMVFVVLAFAASFFTLMAVVIFGAELDSEMLDTSCDDPLYYTVSWSFICCAIGAIGHTGSAFCGLVEVVNSRTKMAMRSNASGTERLDQSFSPYTSFPELPEPNGEANANSSES